MEKITLAQAVEEVLNKEVVEFSTDEFIENYVY